MKSLLFLIVFFGISFFAFAQDTSLFKRKAYKLTVAIDKDNFYEEDIKASPYINPNNTIQLYPGEKIYIEVEQENGVIKSMVAVKEIKDASKTLTISFKQVVKKKTHELMMLQIENPFDKKLIYYAKIFLLQQKKWVNTDVFPIEAKLSGIETWPYIITSIGLNGWTFK